MDKRKNKRFTTKLYVKLNSVTKTFWGVLDEISENGLFIRSNQGFTLDAVIDIEIFMPDNIIILLKGVVRRITEWPEQPRKFGIGIELIKKDAIHKDFLTFLDGQTKQTYAATKEAVFKKLVY